MYRTILVALENSATDDVILKHIEPLAKILGSTLLLAHVADGWAARNYERLKLAESQEMKEDRAYLESVQARLQNAGLETEIELTMGEPADEIVKLARLRGVDLIAMSTHGHRFLSDLIYGSTADKVRHEADIPVLLLKAPRNFS
jgi:nucleotide-binding universal stress UspA family protein